MVSTRGKKRTESSNMTLEENEIAENALGDKETSESLTVNVEEPKTDAKFKDYVEITGVEARNEKYEEKSDEEESEKKVTEVDNSDEKTIVPETNGDSEAKTEENYYEDDEIDDQENVMWEDDEENYEEDNEENVVDEDEGGEEETTEEEEEEEEDEASEEEETEEEVDEEDTQEEKEKAKENGKEAEKHNTEKVEESLKNIKKSSRSSRKKKVGVERSQKIDSGDKPVSSRKTKRKKRVESMGMIFMCSSKTKNDCYQYRVLGLPESKKETVEKIYKGMRLFLYDVDLKLMYGIYKAVGPGGYNIEPMAFKSQFPSQVRFAVLNDCWPLAEEKFKKVIKDNYFTKTKFDCLLNAEQVKKLCKLFITSSKGQQSKKLGRTQKVEKRQRPIRQERTRRKRVGDKRRLALREDPRYRERPRKHLKKVISPVAPLHRPLPALPPPTVPSYVYDKTSDVDAYRRDPYLESRIPDRDRRDPPLNRRDLHRDGRDPHYRDGRDPYPERYRDGPVAYIERRDPYRDGRDPYPERRDLYRDRRDPYLERRDPYRDGRDSYLERRDPYRDERDPYIESRDSYRDSYLELRGPYRDGTDSEPYSTTYRRPEPLTDCRNVYREHRAGVEHRDSYRRDELWERRDIHPVSLGTRHHDDIGTRDSYVSYRERPSYAEPIYSDDYPSRAGLARQYRL